MTLKEKRQQILEKEIYVPSAVTITKAQLFYLIERFASNEEMYIFCDRETYARSFNVESPFVITKNLPSSDILPEFESKIKIIAAINDDIKYTVPNLESGIYFSPENDIFKSTILFEYRN